jgi:hypothetical protein
MATERPERGDATAGHADDEPSPDQLDGGFDDPEQLDVDELEDDDGWGDDEDA